jgi:hypothetical protein
VPITLRFERIVKRNYRVHWKKGKKILLFPGAPADTGGAVGKIDLLPFHKIDQVPPLSFEEPVKVLFKNRNGLLHINVTHTCDMRTHDHILHPPKGMIFR